MINRPARLPERENRECRAPATRRRFSSFPSLLFSPLLFIVVPVSSRSCHFARTLSPRSPRFSSEESNDDKTTALQARVRRAFFHPDTEQAVERIEKDNARPGGRERGRERERKNGSRSWYALDWCKLQVYRGKTRRRRRWSAALLRRQY